MLLLFAGNVKSENQLTESKYVLQIESFDGGEPPLNSLKDALVRIDTFESEMVVITFYLQLTLVTYLAMENEFIDHLQEVFREDFPTSYVRRWCITDKIQ